MSQYMSRLSVPLALGAALLLGACSKGDANNKESTALTRDSALDKDLAMAGRGDSTAQPQLKDVPSNPPATSNPSTPVTRPAPRPSTPRPSTPTPSRPTTTKSGNVVTSNHPSTPAASGGGAVGSIAAGSS